MILLLSSDGDYSTDLIVKWLKSRGYSDFIRLHPVDFVERNVRVYPADGKFSFKGVNFDFASVNVVWYRRFGNFARSSYYLRVKDSIGESAAELLKYEINNIVDFFVSMIPDKAQFIGSTRKGNTNKLVELWHARSIGLEIPYTVVSGEKSDLIALISEGRRLISKSVYNAQNIRMGNNSYTMYTTRVDGRDVESLPDSFFPSMIQEEIDKDFEIRVFYILGKIYSMAIISQDNPQTILDYRRYDVKKPNRFLPCKIDAELEEKIGLFMRKMDLNIGSLDFIRGLDGKTYFLEVNIMGQFGMVDFPCNYGIHRYICDLLIEYDKRNYEVSD